MIDKMSIIINRHRQDLSSNGPPRSAIEGSLARCGYPHAGRNRWYLRDLSQVMWRSVEAELCPVHT